MIRRQTGLHVLLLVVCQANFAVVSGATWDVWGAWGSCSSSCGPGMRYRTRACLAARDSCVGDGIDFLPCNVVSCPAGNGWSVWSAWRECSVTCGSGVRRRYRVCGSNLSSQKSCPGDYIDTSTCNEQFCTAGNRTICSHGWSDYNGACYQFIRRTMSWLDAKRQCESEGAYLVEINDLQEWHFVHDHATAWFWIGATDAATEGVWLWDHSHGAIGPDTFAYWGAGEPNDMHGEDCVVLRHDGFWNDAMCTTTFNYICEKHA